jgi:hypothetical protein
LKRIRIIPYCGRREEEETEVSISLEFECEFIYVEERSRLGIRDWPDMRFIGKNESI